MTTDPLREAEAHLQRYWNVDGLNEIAVALISGLTGLWVWASDVSSLPHTWKGAFSVTFPLLICGGMWGARHAITRIRRRLTYPRAGYVELRQPSPSRRIAMGVIAALVAAALAAAVRLESRDELRRLAVLVPGLASAALLCVLGSRARLRRFYVLAAVLGAAALAIAAAGLSLEMGIIAYWLTASAATFVSGGVTLWRFLHT